MPLFSREPKKKIIWKSFPVPLNGFIEPEGFCSIDTPEVLVKDHLLAADFDDQRVDIRSNEFLRLHTYAIPERLNFERLKSTIGILHVRHRDTEIPHRIGSILHFA